MASYRRQARNRRRTSPRGAAVACAAAGLALILVAGVTMLRPGEPDLRAPRKGLRVAAPTPEQAVPILPKVEPAAPSLVARLAKGVRQSEGRVRSLRSIANVQAREQERISVMARLSAMRGELSTWLDEHPADGRANKLWDRLQRVYITLKKL